MEHFFEREVERDIPHWDLIQNNARVWNLNFLYFSPVHRQDGEVGKKNRGLAWETAFFCSGAGRISAEVLLHSIMFQEGIGWDEFQVCDVACLQIRSTSNWAHQMQQEYEMIGRFEQINLWLRPVQRMSFFSSQRGAHTQSLHRVKSTGTSAGGFHFVQYDALVSICGWCQWQKCLQLAAASILGRSRKQHLPEQAQVHKRSSLWISSIRSPLSRIHRL